jgi:hypothetical protein
LNHVLQAMWLGFWQGVGVEVSFLLLWIGWHALYSKTSHRFDPEHLYHRIHDYITKP